MERHFHCTACGRCCNGFLPLTLADAFAHAGRFPLAMVWTAVARRSRAFELVADIGATLQAGGSEIAVLIAPTSYLPASFSCPALVPDGRCGIHADRPQRCRAMPFYAYREESEQAGMLAPRKGWECDTSKAAPLVYRDGRILERAEFDLERAQLLEQAPQMRVYAQYMMKYMPGLAATLAASAKKGVEGSVATSLSSFLTATRQLDIPGLAARQHAVLADFEARTAGVKALAEFHRNYAGWAKEMHYLATRGGQPG